MILLSGHENRLDKFIRACGLFPTRADRCTYVCYEGAWRVPKEVSNRLEITYHLEWLSHPMSRYLLKAFFDAWELGKAWGSIILEHQINPATVQIQARIFSSSGFSSSG